MNILIYTFGNHDMGMGHVYRMSNLGYFLKNRGHKILFFIPEWQDGMLIIHREEWENIPISLDFFENPEYYQQQLISLAFDCIIVDALDVPETVMTVFREKTALLISFDNRGPGRILADILFNILYKHTMALPEPKIEINDHNYLILPQGLSEINRKEKPIPQKARRILITQGGSDTHGVVPKLISLLPTGDQDTEYFIFIGSGFQHFRELEESLEKTSEKIQIVQNPSTVGDFFYTMDLAVSAGGMTLFELLCCGVPTIVTTNEKKELETISSIAEKNVLINLKEFDEIPNGQLGSVLSDLADDCAKRKSLSINSKMFIDGRGCERISTLIEQYDREGMTL